MHCIFCENESFSLASARKKKENSGNWSDLDIHASSTYQASLSFFLSSGLNFVIQILSCPHTQCGQTDIGTSPCTKHGYVCVNHHVSRRWPFLRLTFFSNEIARLRKENIWSPEFATLLTQTRENNRSPDILKFLDKRHKSARKEFENFGISIFKVDHFHFPSHAFTCCILKCALCPEFQPETFLRL